MCSADSFREAAESGEGSPQRHPVQSPTHDQRQEVPPQDIQVRVCLYTIPALTMHASEILLVCVYCRQCCVGTELVDWLVLQSACVLTRSHAVGMWQALLEEGVLNHGNVIFLYCFFIT